MKKLFALVLIVSIALLTACGAEKTGSADEMQAQDTTLTHTTETEETSAEESVTTEEKADPTTERVSVEEEALDAGDWKGAYLRFLRKWKDENAERTSVDDAQYAFVPMQGLEYPAMVLFDGGRRSEVFSFENGRVLPAEDSDGREDYYILTNLPVYMWNAHLYFLGASGSPAIHAVEEVSVKNKSLTGGTIASAIYASSRGDRDYFYGRSDAEISEAEYNKIVEDIQAGGTEIEFAGLKDLEG